MEIDTRDLYKQKAHLIKTFQNEGRHLQITNTTGKLVVVGDLHGDGRTLHYLLNKYFFESSEFILLFLGDYVDREPSSWNNHPSAVIDQLLLLKHQYPDKIFLLAGNHDLTPKRYVPFHSEFWNKLNSDYYHFYSDVLSSIPVVATTSRGIACCHGTLPLRSDFTTFDLNDSEWIDSIWADYYENNEGVSRVYRPVRLKHHFDQSMKAFKSSLLIKGHNPSAPLLMYTNRCITMQTNRYYNDYCGMHIAIVDLTKPKIETADDIEIVEFGGVAS
ncbi:metallophosphoesterase [Desulforhopalus singaporensis]|uniref:metallophosphoesterase n=1 Tax=Desulforhopalus singaporensis TaxID=91360 RepID=UPI0015A0797F|nr:metallophosphoesterase [Desulforhopalus singaporensis]